MSTKSPVTIQDVQKRRVEHVDLNKGSLLIQLDTDVVTIIAGNQEFHIKCACGSFLEINESQRILRIIDWEQVMGEDNDNES